MVRTASVKISLKAPSDVIGKRNIDIFDTELARQLDVRNQQVYNSKKTEFDEEVVMNASGRKMYWATTRAPLYDETGTAGIIGTAQDITQHKNLLNSIIMQIPGNIYWKNRSGEILGCNQGLVRSLQMAPLKKDIDIQLPDDVVNKSNHDLFDTGLAESLHENDNLVMTGIATEFEETYQDVNGNIVYWNSHKSPWFDDEGNVIGLIGSAHDITPIKVSENG